MRFEFRIISKQEDIELIREIVRRFGVNTDLPEAGRWDRMWDHSLWLEIVSEICTVGGSDPVDDLWDSKDRQKLSLNSLERVSGQLGFTRTVAYVHKILADHKIRYVSPSKASSQKAKQIVSNFMKNDFLFDENHLVLKQWLRKKHKELSRRPDRSRKVKWERSVRDVLASEVHGFGLKTASDYLIEIGCVETLMAFDKRITNLLKTHFGMKGFPVAALSEPSVYDALEDIFIWRICPEVRVNPSVLDRILYQNYSRIKNHFRLSS